jgi:hypothetical protein
MASIKNVILSVVLYGCESWYLSLREVHRLRVLENRVLKEVHGTKGDKISGKWRKLHNEALYHLYSIPNIIRVINRMGWSGHVARMGERCVYRILVGKSDGKKPLGKPRRRWEDDIKMGLQ